MCHRSKLVIVIALWFPCSVPIILGRIPHGRFPYFSGGNFLMSPASPDTHLKGPVYFFSELQNASHALVDALLAERAVVHSSHHGIEGLGEVVVVGTGI